MRRHILAAVALSLSACADATGPASDVAGTWAGESQGISATFVLAEESGTVEGTGTIVTGGGSVLVSVSGTRTWRALSLTLSSPGFPTATFVGVAIRNTIDGTFDAATTGPVRLSLQRE